MSRRNAAVKREILPDTRYGNVVVAQFINCLMVDGKKSVAASALYKSFDAISSRSKEEPLVVFLRAIANVSPKVEVRSKRVGGATYQVPMAVEVRRATALAIRWVIDAAKKRGERDINNKLAGEILDAAGHLVEQDDDSSRVKSSGSKGGAIKKMEDTHRMAEANKAFSHFSGR